MKNRVATWIALALPFVLISCQSPKTLPADDHLDLAEIIVQRYGAYVEEDTGLSEAEKVQWESDGSAFLALFQKGGDVSAPLAKLLGWPVMDRHDEYVEVLEEDPLRKEVFLGDTALMRENIELALK